MIYLICFLGGICIGAGAVAVGVLLFKWYPIVKEYRAPVEAPEKQKKKTAEMQMNELLAWNPGRIKMDN